MSARKPPGRVPGGSPAARRRLPRPVAVVLATLFASLVVIGPVGPAAADGETSIDYVQHRDGIVSVVLGVDGIPGSAAPDPLSVAVTLDGGPVQATAETIESGDVERTTILALDASRSMLGPRFQAAKRAALAFINAAPDDVAVGLVTFAGSPQVVIEPTTSHAAVAAAVKDIRLRLGTSVYDAVVESVGAAGETGSRSILLLSDGKDQGRGTRLGSAVRSAVRNGVVVDVVALDQERDALALLARIADASGGRVISSDAGGLAEVFTAQAEALASQMLVSFAQPDEVGGSVPLAVSIDAAGETYTDEALIELPPAEIGARPVEVGDPAVGPAALWVGATALALGLTVLLVYVLVGVTHRPSLAQRQVAHYAGSPIDRFGRPAAESGGAAGGLRESAVAATERVVTGDFETRVAQRLTGAGSALTAAEWLLIHAAIAVGSAFLGFVLTSRGAFAVLMFLFGVAAPWLWLMFRHSRRLAAFNAQLADSLQLIAGGLSAGLSLPQAVDTVVREGAEPMAAELRRALIEARLGVEVEDALDGVAQRMDSEDFGWVVMAIRIQREVGGNLSELLNTVADTLREREFLRRQVKVLSAEGRFSAWILGALPVVMFVYMLLVRPDFIQPLFTEPLGLLLLATAVILLLLGFWVLSRLVKVEV